MISLEFDKKAIKSLEKSIAENLAEITSQVGLNIYNQIIVDEKPVWSGAYRASWTLSAGSPDTSGKVQSTPDNPYPDPGFKFSLKSKSYEPVYVSNYVKDKQGDYYAGLVEYEGTYTHPDSGWMIATHAKNTVASTYKYRPKLY